MSSIDLTWVIGGPQGGGVETAANIFAGACAGCGLKIFGKREYYSNIKGEHSYFGVRVSDSTIRSNVSGITMLVAFDAETIFRHAEDVFDDGAIVYESDLSQVKADEVQTLDLQFKGRLVKYLDSKNKPATIQGALDAAKERGVTLYPVSFKAILSNLADETGNPKLRGMFRMQNVLAVSVSLGLLGLAPDTLLSSVANIFAKKKEIAEMNKHAANYAYNFAAAKFQKFKHQLSPIPKEPNTILVQGFQSTGLAKIACGCRFQSYYPITPASDESVFLESNETFDIENERPGSTMVVQTEDEISAIGMVIGAALTGTRSATSTSGPGFSLMAEMLGWAGINEVPIVVTLYQRSGPSTGLPTRHGQDDLQFAIHAGHGDFPRIVYASGDTEEGFYDTAKCFNFAENFQIPVIHMMDKFIASTVSTVPRFDVKKITIERGKLLQKIDSEGYTRFAPSPDGMSPRSKLGLENGIFWNTGDESDEHGHISEDPVNRVYKMDKRAKKLEVALQTISKEDQAVKYEGSETCIVSWGSTKGPILDAIEMLKKENKKVGFVQIKLLHPFPADYIKSLLKDVNTIINIEANHSAQLGSLLNEYLDRKVDYHILKYTGRPMTCNEIYESVKKVLDDKAEKKEVLTYGV
ncbi:MAG: 2-oxoacid:acceptor oxidoreductase subunit alpha [Thaumarchaeota archaeon]|nr:2-oxoacid:acceptor oxidoreductase subunit alpha [Nitrososphaerota archaeon]MDE1867159.1 2-oxoacid:acceptor oxidoreductase subunit alpha [Nitrososphaerota archaeon]